MSISRPASTPSTFSSNFNQFTRSNFYLYCPAITEEELEAAKKIVAEKAADYPFFAQQLGLYYGFHKRQKANAEQYFTILLDAAREAMQAEPSTKNKLFYATALSFVAHADSIDGGFRPTPLDQYKEVLTVLDEILAGMSGSEFEAIRLEFATLKGFTLRYTAMMYHRKNFDSTPEDRVLCFAQAEASITDALTIQRAILEQQTAEKADAQQLSAINADIAESEHIFGVIYTAQGKTELAMRALQAAKIHWLQTLNQGHTFRFITEQSLGDLYRRQIATDEKAFEKAEKCLLSALRGHEHYFGTTVNADVAKTFHFLGNLYEDMKLYALSDHYYTRSHVIKSELRSAPSIIKATADAMLRINGLNFNLMIEDNHLLGIKEELIKHPEFDWNLPVTFEAYKQNLPRHISNVQTIARIIHFLNDRKEAADYYKKILELGTYYNHLGRDPEAALRYLVLTNTVHANNHPAMWAQLHKAFSYQQLLAGAKKNHSAWEIDYFQKKAKEFYTPYLPKPENNHDQAKVKIVAFAWCLKALTEYELVDLQALQTNDAKAQADLKTAVDSYKTAIEMYEEIAAIDNQYARVKNRYAQILAESPTPIPGHPKPIEVFRALEAYWQENADATNPYPARFFVSYADFLVKVNAVGTLQLARAIEKYKKAVELLKVDPALNANFIAEIEGKITEIQKKVPRLSPPLLPAGADRKQQAAVSASMGNLTIEEPRRTAPAP
jgi:tetratricopeptide (TPR) repeat protein